MQLTFKYVGWIVHEDLGKRPRVLDPHSFHLNQKISVAHAKYFHTNFPM